MAEAWAALERFAQSEQQRVWIQQELGLHPPLEDQDPFSWLLWRSKIAEGVSEEEAWAWVQSTNNMPVVQQPIDKYVADHQAFTQGGDVDMGGGGGEVKTEGAFKMEPDYGFQSNVAPQPGVAYASGSGSGVKNEVKEETKPQLPVDDKSFQQRYVQMNDVLPLPRDPIPYEDIEIDEPGGSPDASGSDVSSSGDSDDTKPIIRPQQEAVPVQKPSSINALNRPAHLGSPANSLPSSRGASPSSLIDPALRTITPTPLNSIGPPPNAVASSSTTADKTPSRQPSKSRSPTKATVPLPPSGIPTPTPATTVNMATIRPLITRTRLRGENERPISLWMYLRKPKDGGDPPFQPNPEELREIMLALRAHAPSLYKSQMADNLLNALQLNRYMKAMAKDPVKWEVAIEPTILLLSESLMSFDTLTETKIGKSVQAVSKNAEAQKLSAAPEIKKAFVRYQDFCIKKIIPRSTSTSAVDQAKKRKLEDPPAQVGPESGPSKKAALTNGKKPTPIPSTAAPKAAASAAGPSRPTITTGAGTAPSTTQLKSASSAVSPAVPAPPKRVPLPGFKKRNPSDDPSAPVAASPTTPAPAPALTDLLAQTKARMKLEQAQAGRSLAQINAAAAPEAANSVRKGKVNKKGQTVRWSDTVLGARPLVETVILEHSYRDYGWTDDMHGQTMKSMVQDEGEALHAAAAQKVQDDLEDTPKELIEWYQPELYVDTPLLPPTPEAIAQEARERGILAAAGGASADETTATIVDPAPGMTYPIHEDARPIHEKVKGLLDTLTGPLGLGVIAANAPPLSHLQHQYGHPQSQPPQNLYTQAPPVYPGHQQQQQQQPDYPMAGQYRDGYAGQNAAYPGQQGWQAGPGPSSGPGGYRQGYDQQHGPDMGRPPPQNGWADGPQGWGGDDRGRWPPADNSSGNGPGRGKSGRRNANNQNRGRHNIPCNFFAQGHCSKGSKCDFRH